MSNYRTRQAKRAKRLAISAAKRDHRETIAERFFLIVSTRRGSCNRCGTAFHPGDDAVFRKRPGAIYCLNCSGLLNLKPRPSERWEAKHRPRRRSQTRRRP